MILNSMCNKQPLASFKEEDWSNIVHALRSYVICEEEKLMKQNVGDREWDNLEKFSILANDIEFYVIGVKT